MRNEITGILSNGEQAYDFSQLISNWTKELTLFTNGASTLTPVQATSLSRHKINIVEKEIKRLIHTGGYLDKIIFKDCSEFFIKVLYAPAPFEQYCLTLMDVELVRKTMFTLAL